MEKKGNQKRQAQFSRIAVDDIMNINEGASKKRKQSVPDHLRPAVLKKLKLKPNPTLLFSQFKPKENEDNETITSYTRAEKSCSQTTKESSKVGFPKGWTPPLKNAASQNKSDNPSTSFRRTGILKESNNVKKERNSKSEKPMVEVCNFETNKKSTVSVNVNTQKQNTHEFAGMNSPEVAQKPFNGGSQDREEVIIQDQSDATVGTSGENPYRNQVGIQSLLEAIGIIEANTENNDEMENSNENKSKHEVDEIGGLGEQEIFKEDESGQISKTPVIEAHSNELLIMKPTSNDGGLVTQDGNIDSQSKEIGIEFDTQPIEQLTEKNSPQSDQHTDFIDLTNECDEVQSRSLEVTVDSEKTVEMEPIDQSIEKVDKSHNIRLLTSGSVKYTETVIEDLKYPLVCTIVNEARNSTEVLKFLGSDSRKNKNSRSDQTDSMRGASLPFDKHNVGENELVDTNDCSTAEEGLDAEDENIIKEIRIYVYDSLTSSEKQEDENSNCIEYEKEIVGQVSQNDLESKNCENPLVTNCEQEINDEHDYVEETEIDCEVEENKEEYDGETEIDCKVEESREESEVRHRNDKDEAENYQQNTNKEDENDYQQDEDEIIEEKKENLMDEDNHMQKDEEENVSEHMTSESNTNKECEENEEQVDENAGEGLKNSMEDDKNELWNEDDDAFDEVIDMSCTQLIHIENEYSNKKEVNEDNVDKTAALRTKPLVDLNVGKVQIPWVSDESKKVGKNNARPIPHQSLQWVDRLGEEKQKLRAVVQELSQLNTLITQARQKLWPSIKIKENK